MTTRIDSLDWLETYRKRAESGELGSDVAPDTYKPNPIPWPADWGQDIKVVCLNVCQAPYAERFVRLALSLRLSRYLRELALLTAGKLEVNDFYRTAMLRWSNRDSPHHGMILLGGEGAGKSVTALGLCLRASERGQNWDFLDAGEFADVWSKQDYTRIGQLKTVGLLVIDEIGDCEDLKGNPMSLMKRVINSRYRDELPVVLGSIVAGKTKNGVDVPELRKAIGNEVVDRFPKKLRIKTSAASYRK
jgi:hypothetical protein